VAGEEDASGLNANHRRVLLCTLAHLEQLLGDIERTATTGDGSPLSKIQPDLSPTQQRVVTGYVARLRAQLTDALAALGIEPPAQRTSASWAIRTALTFASIALQDSASARLRGYGELGPGASALIARVEADLDRTLIRLGSYLAQELGRGLAERIARLGQVPVDRALVDQLERVITERGLVELRGALESLLEQLESQSYEIAVFGRVSSGKSSLLNTILELEALPVGVTPVTAVPTRVAWGERACAEVRLAEAAPLEIPLAQLTDYVSESGNPTNRKRVERVTVRVPSPRLRAGVVFVDTPGIGALATHGTRAAYAYLPRCDLGVVLIDAGGAPTPEDLEVLRLLYDSAIPALVVVSKSDLLDDADQDRLRAYLQRELTEALGLALPVHFVTSRGAQAECARRWFASEVEPLCARSRALAEASAARKLAHLREAVLAALRTRLGARDTADDGGERRARLESLAVEIERRLAQAERRCDALTDALRQLAPEALAIAARLLAADPPASPAGAAPVASRALRAVADKASGAVRAELLDTRDQLGWLLRQMSEAANDPLEPELSLDLLGTPSLALPEEVERLVVPARRWPAWWLERRLRARLERSLRDTTGRAFSYLGADLRAWSRIMLARLAEQAATLSEPLRAQARRLSGPDAVQGDLSAMSEDLRRLESPPAVPQ
jgi:GTP-binding protein EngB required for normal cell division